MEQIQSKSLREQAGVSNTLRINNVIEFGLSSITMRKENDQAIIIIAYERRVELAANLDVVAKFDTVLQ
jgi:hypothetical protein